MTHAERADGTRSPPFPRPPSQCSTRGIGEGRTSTHINLARKEPPPAPAEKAASLSSSNFLAFSAPREANEASNTKGGENSLATSSTESPFRTRLSKALQTTLNGRRPETITP
eukprot:scaffold9550_cov111-Isochrysis_galbana.AAC.6